jgi:hypothetical protein
VSNSRSYGRIQSAPENFISDELIAEINADGLNDTRRNFLRRSFAAAAGVVAASGLATGNANAADHPGLDGDPAILKLPKHSTSLGNPVDSSSEKAKSATSTALTPPKESRCSRVRDPRAHTVFTRRSTNGANHLFGIDWNGPNACAAFTVGTPSKRGTPVMRAL